MIRRPPRSTRTDTLFPVTTRFRSLVLPRGGGLAMQDDTLVMPEHRGRRLGPRLILATLQVLTRNHPERRALHTWTEPEHHSMSRTNTDSGSVARDGQFEVQRMPPPQCPPATAPERCLIRVAWCRWCCPRPAT